MRDNTSAIISSPEFSLFQSIDGQRWGKLRFESTGHCMAFSAQHARTSNEHSWGKNSDWVGLETQSVDSFWNSGIAEHSKNLVMQESGKLKDKPSRPGEFRATITGGFWDTPSVIAGLPLAARSRVRTKLPPKSLRIAIFMSAGVDAASMAKVTAKIAHALWQYTLAGGAVTLDVAYVGMLRASSTGAKALAVETRVNASDVASLSAALSPVWFRCVAGRLITATSDSPDDSIWPARKCPFPNTLWIGGSMGDALRAGDAVLKELALV